MERIARRLSKSESRRERGKVARLLRLRDADEYLNSIRASQDGDHKGTPAHHLEWDTYLPCHPAYISLLEPPQQQIATDWKAEDHSTGNYIIEIIHRFSPSSIMTPASHPPVAWPLALRSAFKSRTAKLLETPEGGSER